MLVCLTCARCKTPIVGGDQDGNVCSGMSLAAANFSNCARVFPAKNAAIAAWVSGLNKLYNPLKQMHAASHSAAAK